MSMIDRDYYPWEDVPLDDLDLWTAKSAAGHYNQNTDFHTQQQLRVTVGLDRGADTSPYRDVRLTIDFPDSSFVGFFRDGFISGPGGTRTFGNTVAENGDHFEYSLGDLPSGTTLSITFLINGRLNIGPADITATVSADPDANGDAQLERVPHADGLQQRWQ